MRILSRGGSVIDLKIVIYLGDVIKQFLGIFLILSATCLSDTEMYLILAILSRTDHIPNS